jgi:hypothetical protein
MKARIVLLVAALVLLLLGGVLPAQSGKADVPPVYAVAQGSAAGGDYYLAGGTWQVSGIVTAPGYRLQWAWPLQAAGCCCVWLPCTPRSAP